MLRQGSCCLSAAQDVLQQKNAHFISVQALIFIALLRHHAQTVAVRIRSNQQIRAGLLTPLQANLQGVRRLRIRVGAGGEVSIGLCLLGDDLQIFDTDVFQDTGDRNQACSVRRRVDYLQAGGQLLLRPLTDDSR